MELTAKQRAALRSMANGLPVVLTVGKEGISEATIKEAYDALQARELIKCAVGQSAPLTAREAASALCERTGAQPVQAIGRKFVLYRRNDKEPKIEIEV
ncbi:MAG: YhbY family RNA-binding protein [Clostridiales bacterium]|nr:YhbY family RNA-binding protein [Clostridiales bacterium]